MMRALGGVGTIGAAAALALALAPSRAVSAPSPKTATATKLFLDVHDFGPGKVTAEAVADAHKKDLTTQAKYGVRYQSYWFDEKAGKVYCLAEAPSAEAAVSVHRAAHGLVANRIAEVSSDGSGDSARWTPRAGQRLFLDVHHLGAGKVSAADVAGAHQKDLAVQTKHDARYLNYWFDAAEGTVTCLVEAPSADAALAVHREAHGLMPDAISEVVQGR